MTDKVYSDKLATQSHLIESLKEQLNLLRNVDATEPTPPPKIGVLTQLKESLLTQEVFPNKLLS